MNDHIIHPIFDNYKIENIQDEGMKKRIRLKLDLILKTPYFYDKRKLKSSSSQRNANEYSSTMRYETRSSEQTNQKVQQKFNIQEGNNNRNTQNLKNRLLKQKQNNFFNEKKYNENCTLQNQDLNCENQQNNRIGSSQSCKKEFLTTTNSVKYFSRYDLYNHNKELQTFVNDFKPDKFSKKTGQASYVKRVKLLSQCKKKLMKSKSNSSKEIAEAYQIVSMKKNNDNFMKDFPSVQLKIKTSSSQLEKTKQDQQSFDQKLQTNNFKQFKRSIEKYQNSPFRKKVTDSPLNHLFQTVDHQKNFKFSIGHKKKKKNNNEQLPKINKYLLVDV